MQALTHDGFRSTCWPLVRLAQESRGAPRSALYGVYWRAVRAFLRKLGAHAHEVEDITQGFFLRFEERNDLVRVDPARGKFRNFLRTCARRYLYRVRAHAKAEKNGGKGTFVRPDAALAGCVPPELRESVGPEQLALEREADEIIGAAEERLRSWYERRGKATTYAVLIECLHEPDDSTDAERAAILRQSSAAIKQERSRMRKRFAAYVRAELRQRGVRDGDMRKRLRELAAVLAPERGEGDA